MTTNKIIKLVSLPILTIVGLGIFFLAKKMALDQEFAAVIALIPTGMTAALIHGTKEFDD